MAMILQISSPPSHCDHDEAGEALPCEPEQISPQSRQTSLCSADLVSSPCVSPKSDEPLCQSSQSWPVDSDGLIKTGGWQVDDDDSDEECFVGKPRWSYNGPSLEQLEAEEPLNSQTFVRSPSNVDSVAWRAVQ